MEDAGDVIAAALLRVRVAPALRYPEWEDAKVRAQRRREETWCRGGSRAMMTEFEYLTRDLPPHEWLRSRELTRWVKKNAHRRYVPEELLAALHIRITEDSVMRAGRDRG